MKSLTNCCRLQQAWNSQIDMSTWYSARFKVEAQHYFEKFGHSTHRMTIVAVNGELSRDIYRNLVR